MLDLFSREVVGWSMSSRIDTELVMNALLMAVWQRNPTNAVTVHSDQGSQYTSKERRDFLTAHRLESSLSRRGNWHDCAVAESFFQLLTRAHQAKDLCNQGRRQARHLRLHRDALQSEAAPRI
ncbi:DDE-type integrase/transposase/recombinase [Duganella sp. CY42W]|uniref:DDE-type integrase/transposase/recombinase n=1 Tax=Duganella levis TaxID=2692169 RepID=A0ABW9W9H3_9BURK|nr:DDE-type integrase/transposase/recombinase [Duganella levis]